MAAGTGPKCTGRDAVKLLARDLIKELNKGLGYDWRGVCAQPALDSNTRTDASEEMLRAAAGVIAVLTRPRDIQT